MKNHIYYALLCNCVFFSTPTYAEDTMLQKAKQNFDQNCVRSFPEAVLNPAKVQEYSFTLKNTADQNFPMIYSLEKAQLSNKQTIKINDQGCEFYRWDMTFQLNAGNIEKDQKFCAECLYQQLKSFTLFFRTSSQDFYKDSLKTLQQQLKQKKTLKTGDFITQKGSDEMPSTLKIVAIQKQKNQQYLIHIIASVGPL